MPKAPTVYDVAQRAGVSIATVSRVLRRPDDVRESTRDVVRAAVRELGYVPSGAARGLAARQTGVLGLCFPDLDGIDDLADLPAPVRVGEKVEVVRDVGGAVTGRWSNLYLGEVMRGAELEAWRTGHAVMIGVARALRRAEEVNELAGRVDGLAVLAKAVPDDLLAHIARRVPVVVMAGPPQGDAYDHIFVDNRAGTRAVVDHLVGGHGITDVAFVGGPVDSPDSLARFEGLRDALASASLPVPDEPWTRGDHTRVGARELATRLVAQLREPGAAPLPRALVCSNDQTALGLLDVLAEAGIDVPGDVVLTGFDGIDAAQASIPRLTTVSQPMVDLGRAAVELLRSRLTDPSAPPATVTLPVRVLLRESCGCH